jgi:pimeloyl-ACP methyl ester carboxylesterase
VEFAEFAELPNPWLVGWSFGTDLALMHGCEPSVVGAILLSPPLRYASATDLGVWAASGKPVVAIVPEHDDYLRPEEARERFAAVPQCEVVGVDNGKHLWTGQAERVLDEIVGEWRRTSRCHFLAPGPVRWRSPTPPRTRTGPVPCSPMCRLLRLRHVREGCASADRRD